MATDPDDPADDAVAVRSDSEALAADRGWARRGEGPPAGRRGNVRDTIRHMAAVTFLERGLADTSIQDVAERLGLPKANIYYHFGSKEELLFEIVSSGLPPLTARLREIIGYPLSVKDRLRLAFRANSRACVEEVNAAVVTMLRRDIAFLSDPHRAAYVALRDEYQKLMEALLREGVESGEFASALDMKLTTFAILGMLGSLNHWFRPGGSLTYEDVADSWWELICRGLEPRA